MKLNSSPIVELCVHFTCSQVNYYLTPMIKMHLPDHYTDDIDTYNVQAPRLAILGHPFTGVSCVKSVCFALLDMPEQVAVYNERHPWLIFDPSGM
jgi:hypothetical protein